MTHLLNKKWPYLLGILIVLGALIGLITLKHLRSPLQGADFSRIIEEKVVLASGQPIAVFHAEEPEKGLIIYIADSHSTNSHTTHDYAKQFADLSYYVASLDSKVLLSSMANTDNHCANLDDKLAELANELQKKLNIDTTYLPILVGNNEGASLVYTALAQSEKNHFHAGVSLDFTPQLNTRVSLCETHDFSSRIEKNSTHIDPLKHLTTSWYIFQNHHAPQNAAVKEFTDQVGNAKLTIAEPSPSTALSSATQILQWLDPRLADQISSDNSDSNLPLIEVPTEQNTDDTLAILLTGDGGWAEIDKSVAKNLAEKGIPTVALDSLSYFWRARTVEETTDDIEDILNQYLEKWNKKRVILVGYSFGADALPFIANNLSTKAKKTVALVALLGMGKSAAFEFHLSSWMNSDHSTERKPTLPEVKKMSWANAICLYGIDDEDSVCNKTGELGIKVISMSGDHHFDEKYDELVQHIIENAAQATQSSPTH